MLGLKVLKATPLSDMFPFTKIVLPTENVEPVGTRTANQRVPATTVLPFVETMLNVGFPF